MAVITINGAMTTVSMPNYLGTLWTLTPTRTPTLNLINQLGNSARVEEQYEFGINTDEFRAPAQPAVLEGDDFVASKAYAMTHQKNVTQIFNETYSMSFSKSASAARIHSDSYMTAGQAAAQPDPWAHQRALRMKIIQRDMNYTFLRGTFTNPADPTASARGTRGILEAADGGTVVAGGSGALSKAMIDDLLKSHYDVGALDDPTGFVLVVNSFQKLALSAIYGYAPQHRNIGGVNIEQIETDFGIFPVVLERDMPADTLGLINFGVVSTVYNLVKNPDTGETYGVLFEKEVPQSGSNFSRSLYGEMGIDHGPGFYHGKITGLATS